jgi:hypothetical protein
LVVPCGREAQAKSWSRAYLVEREPEASAQGATIGGHHVGLVGGIAPSEIAVSTPAT